MILGSSNASTKWLVAALAIMLLTWGVSNVDLAFAHHKEGHSGGPGCADPPCKDKNKKPKKSEKEQKEEKQKAKKEAKEIAKKLHKEAIEKSQQEKAEARELMKEQKELVKQGAEDAIVALDPEDPDYQLKLDEIMQILDKSLQQINQEFVETIHQINQERKITFEDVREEYKTTKFEFLEDVEEQEKSLEIKQAKIKEQGILVKKVDKRIQKLLQSDEPEKIAEKIGLDYQNGEIKIVLELSDTDPLTIETIRVA